MIKQVCKVSIAIPFYNAERYIAEAIESVIRQTYKEWKLILLDDGSTDNSLNIAKKYELLDSRIKVYSDGENKNLGYRLNQIPTLVDTKYLARMDADDIMHPERIEKQLEFLKENPEIDVLGTNAYTINEFNKVVGVRAKLDEKEEIIRVNSFIHPTIMAKNQWFKDNPYDVNAVRMEDAELWYRVREKNNFQMISEPLFFYREFGSSYYKKYFATYKSKKYILKKYNNEYYWKVFFRKLLIKSYIYKLFSTLGKEQFLINKRNMIVYKEQREISDFV